MKRILILPLFLLFFAVCGFAQSADVVERLVSTEKVTYGQAAYMSAVSLGLVDDDATFEQAFSKLRENDTIKEGVSVNDVIPLSHLAFIVMRTWKIKPCMMYALFPSPHYALRSLKANSLVSSSADPKKYSSGHELLVIISECIDMFVPYTESEFRGLRVYK